MKKICYITSSINIINRALAILIDYYSIIYVNCFFFNKINSWERTNTHNDNIKIYFITIAKKCLIIVLSLFNIL